MSVTMTEPVAYRGYTISPADGEDYGAWWMRHPYTFQVDDYDGDPDSSNRHQFGSGTTIDDCKRRIDEQLESI
jgi:hypothetical protein